MVDPRSDEHRYVDNNGRLSEAVLALNNETVSPEVVIATGDLTNWGQHSEYDQLVHLVGPLEPPLLPLPGNHDDRDELRAAFPETPWVDAAHASWVTTIGDVNLIGLDSTIPGAAGAEFDEDREQWLITALATAETSGASQTLLALHHPPFVTGIDWMDRAGFIGLERLTAVLTESRSSPGSGVDRIICGHLHRPISSVVAGVPAQVGISTVQHVALDLAPDAPITMINDPAGYLLHNFVGQSWVTHTRYVATGEAPYRPDWA